MKARLLRALQRGGCAGPLAADVWGVWRHPDRRGRVIGEVQGSEIDLLRARGHLAVLASPSRAGLLIWTGPRLAPSDITPTAPGVLLQDGAVMSGPLLLRALQALHDPHVRRRASAAVELYLSDIEAAAQSGRHRGMNWSDLSLGGRVQGGRVADPMARAGYARDAAERLHRIRSLLPVEDLRLLHMMVLHDFTLSRIAKETGLRKPIVERRAVRLLQHLADLQDRVVSSPEQVARRFV